MPLSSVSTFCTGPPVEEGAADPARSPGATSAARDPWESSGRAGVRRVRSSRRSAATPTTARVRQGSRRRTGPAVADRSVSAAAVATRQSARKAPSATRGRRTPTTPTRIASRATVARMPPISTGLSFSPNLSIASSLSGRGVASIARLPTASRGEVTPVSSAATPSEVAAAAAPASRPAAPPAIQRRRGAPVRRSEVGSVDDMQVVRYGGCGGWVRGHASGLRANRARVFD